MKHLEHLIQVAESQEDRVETPVEVHHVDTPKVEVPAGWSLTDDVLPKHDIDAKASGGKTNSEILDQKYGAGNWMTLEHPESRMQLLIAAHGVYDAEHAGGIAETEGSAEYTPRHVRELGSEALKRVA